MYWDLQNRTWEKGSLHDSPHLATSRIRYAISFCTFSNPLQNSSNNVLTKEQVIRQAQTRRLMKLFFVKRLAYLNLRIMIASVVDKLHIFFGLFVAVEENPRHRRASAAVLERDVINSLAVSVVDLERCPTLGQARREV